MSLSTSEIQAVQWLFAFMPENPVIVDVGANKGTWSDLFLEEYKDSCEVHLFEPNELLLNYCRVKYDYKENVIYYRIALSSVNDDKPFYCFTGKYNGLSSLYHNPKWDYLPKQNKIVRTHTLYSFFSGRQIPHIDFLKIDVEGADMDVMIGAKELLEHGRISIIQIEYSEHWKLAGKTILDLITFTAQYGYDCYVWDDGFVPVGEKEVNDLDNIYVTKLPIRNLSKGWNKPFIENTKDLKPHFALELGSCEGLTAKYICEHLLTGKDARLICVDPLNDYYLQPGDMPEMIGQYQRWKANARGLPINLYRKKSADAYDELKEFRFDLIYVDGDHTEEGVYNDGKMALELCKRGGIIIFDDYENYADYTTAGIEKFMREYRPHVEIVRRNYQLVIRKV